MGRIVSTGESGETRPWQSEALLCHRHPQPLNKETLPGSILPHLSPESLLNALPDAVLKREFEVHLKQLELKS